jgi:hypothetical protein
VVGVFLFLNQPDILDHWVGLAAAATAALTALSGTGMQMWGLFNRRESDGTS